MWVFYSELSEVAYQSPSDAAIFLFMYCAMAACVLLPPYMETVRNESHRPDR